MFTSVISPKHKLLLCDDSVLGVVYPLATRVLARAVLFPSQAAGASFHRGNILVGSSLIGQSFFRTPGTSGSSLRQPPAAYNGLASAARISDH